MPPKPTKDQTKSTPTNKSANVKDTIKGLKKFVDSLEKEKGTWEKKLQEKDKEIERLKVVLTEENKELKEELNESLFEDETSKTAAQIPVSDSETLMKDLLERNKRLIVENSELKEQIKKLYEVETKNSDLKKQIEELQKTQSQEKERKERLSRVEKEKSNLEREFEELQKTLSQKEKENKSKLEEKDKENSKLSKTIDDLQTDIAQLKKANKSNSPKPAASRDLKDAEAQVKQLKERNEKLMEEKIKAVKEVYNLKNRLAEKDKENSQLTKTINDFQTENEQLKKTNKSNSPKSAASRDLKDAEALVKQLKEKNEKLMEEKIKAVKEVDNLKNRAFGSKIYRPIELVEKFSEVYDNEWNGALAELLEKINNEKAVIQILLHIVMDAYQFCTEKAETFYGSLKGAVSQTFKTMTLTATQLKVMNDYRIATAEHLVTNLQEEFCQANKFDEGNVTHYQKACIRVCWLLAVQDPPVFMDVKENSTGAKFDSDKYKCFTTKKGNVVDYIVWPVLYLHKGGSLLSKGIAQRK